MFKFNINDRVFCLKDNKIKPTRILSRKFIENNARVQELAKGHKYDARAPFGVQRISYYTDFGVFGESQLFTSREELINNL